jgi:leucyl/phenylalanyl-tRNA--protein transferase
MKSQPFYWFAQQRYAADFPPIELALQEPDGLLAAGGDLSAERLLSAYRRGIFPWYSDHQPILWWSPDPRCVLFPERMHVSRRLRQTLRRGRFAVTCDRDFQGVLAGCADPRRDGGGTWLNHDMQRAYTRLHQQRHAHSVECWLADELAGGLYGLSLGRVFYGESMFSRVTDASKVALAHLCRWLQAWGYALTDCQVHNSHLQSLGAEMIPRPTFIALLDRHCEQLPSSEAWGVILP